MGKKKRSRRNISGNGSNKKGIVREYVCPKCKSKNINRGSFLRRFFGFPKYKCNSCHYQDVIFPYLPSKKKRKKS